MAAPISPVDLGVTNRKTLPFPALVSIRGSAVAEVAENADAINSVVILAPVVLTKTTLLSVGLLVKTSMKFAGEPKVINLTLPDVGIVNNSVSPPFSTLKPPAVFVIVAPFGVVTGGTVPNHPEPTLNGPVVIFKHAIIITFFC
jgi:hypothetical protein